MFAGKILFLSTPQPSAALSFAQAHGILMEKTAIETELSYLTDVDASNVPVDVTGDYIVLERAVKTTGEYARIFRVARKVVGCNRVLSRVLVVSDAA
jgi:osmotically-inducible protein OsmY